ncbi:MAG: hypothetical protein HY591_03515 [Candidatus Omnitrophica bacterium]|nr:hypothetical protein [Candidatus Omnitrophota bacterium]
MPLRCMVLALAFLCGCVTVQVPGYIKADHPYARKMYGNFDKIVIAAQNILVRNGWKIKAAMDPSVYERVEGEDGSTDKDILFFTDIKQHSMVLYSSYTHLNVFIHAIAEGAQVEIRYGKVTPLLVKQFRSARNDKLANKLLEQIEQELLETE